MATKLRDLIRSVRACRTQAEEKAVIAKECADIRTSFRSKGMFRFKMFVAMWEFILVYRNEGWDRW